MLTLLQWWMLVLNVAKVLNNEVNVQVISVRQKLRFQTALKSQCRVIFPLLTLYGMNESGIL